MTLSNLFEDSGFEKIFVPKPKEQHWNDYFDDENNYEIGPDTRRRLIRLTTKGGYSNKDMPQAIEDYLDYHLTRISKI